MNKELMREAIRMSVESVRSGTGGPFAALVVKEGTIVGRGTNRVTSTNDPTAHAEVVAIRDACSKLGSFQLNGCEIYTTCEPCPMCLGAIYWARPDRVYFGNTRADAARIGFDDDFIYRELSVGISERRIPMIRILSDEAGEAFTEWDRKPDKVKY